MRSVRSTRRSVLLLAGATLLGACVCLPPVAWHDGLPAWAPEPGRTEGRVGYQRLFFFGGDSADFLGQPVLFSNFNVGYLTPGVRVGLGRAPVAAEAGLTSVVLAGNGYFTALVGPEFGVGYQSRDISLMFRPSLYLLDVTSDSGSGAVVRTNGWAQLSMMVGTGSRVRPWSFAAGGRVSQIAMGPFAVAGFAMHPVEFRAELSYMLPSMVLFPLIAGNSLTLGLTVAAPTQPEPESEPYGW